MRELLSHGILAYDIGAAISELERRIKAALRSRSGTWLGISARTRPTRCAHPDLLATPAAFHLR
jgi:hypothetical protein